MRFSWREYTRDDAALADLWLDAEAIHETGIDEGWQTFCDYSEEDSKNFGGKDFCFIISADDDPFAVMYIGTLNDEFTVSEYIVAPYMRGRGYGSAAIRELLENRAHLLGRDFTRAKVVIFPDNIASQRAFEKAGFVYVSTHPDGDAMYYEWRS